jgi:3-methyladenine DNA glycosylase AlkD
MTITAQKIHKKLTSVSTKKRKDLCQSFFQTHKGGYAEGDIFLGVTVPDTRKVIGEFRKDFSIELGQELLGSRFHEERFCGLIVLMSMYKKTKDIQVKKKIYSVYLKNIGNKKPINNWDLVDVSVYHIVGDYMYTYMSSEERRVLIDTMMKSKDVWIRRTIVVATFFAIRNHDNTDILYIAEKMLGDTHHLIHKAVGWMLRESGKKCSELDLISFLRKHKEHMPRVMYSYAKERLGGVFVS